MLRSEHNTISFYIALHIRLLFFHNQCIDNIVFPEALLDVFFSQSESFEVDVYQSTFFHKHQFIADQIEGHIHKQLFLKDSDPNACI